MNPSQAVSESFFELIVNAVPVVVQEIKQQCLLAWEFVLQIANSLVKSYRCAQELPSGQTQHSSKPDLVPALSQACYQWDDPPMGQGVAFCAGKGVLSLLIFNLSEIFFW